MTVFLHNGRWDTLYGHAKRLGIPIATVETRVHRYGNTPENRERILAPYDLGKGRKFKWEGHWGTLREHAARLGIGTATLDTRIHRYGNTPGTVHKLLRPGRLVSLYSYCGVWKGLREWARIFGRTEDAVRKAATGHVITDVGLAKLRRPYRRREVRTYALGGETRTLGEWAELAGVGEDTLRARMRRGMSLAESVAVKRTKHARPKVHGFGRISDSTKRSLRSLGVVI